MSGCTDTLFMNCHMPDCDFRLDEKVECGKTLSPSRQIRWHERMISHIRSVHVRPKTK